jgi:aspartate-semialdehyde dehydrogenase
MRKGFSVVFNIRHRYSEDVPVFIPEINDEHLRLHTPARKQRGGMDGLLVAKPNASIQSTCCLFTR